MQSTATCMYVCIYIYIYIYIYIHPVHAYFVDGYSTPGPVVIHIQSFILGKKLQQNWNASQFPYVRIVQNEHSYGVLCAFVE